MGSTYFDDEQEIGPQGLALLRNVLSDESGGAKLDHGSGGIVPLRAA